jgi:hypothetical protein
MITEGHRLQYHHIRTLTYVYELMQLMTSCFVQFQLDQGSLLFYAFE